MPKKFVTIGYANGFNKPVGVLKDSDFAKGKVRIGNLSLKEASRIYWNLHDVDVSLNFSAAIATRADSAEDVPNVQSVNYYKLQVGNLLERAYSEYDEDDKYFFKELTIPIYLRPPHSHNDPRLMDDSSLEMEMYSEDNREICGYFYLYGPFIEDNDDLENLTPFEFSYYYLLDFNLTGGFSSFVITTDLQGRNWKNVATEYTSFLGHYVKFYIASDASENDFTYTCDISFKEKIWTESDYQDDAKSVS